MCCCCVPQVADSKTIAAKYRGEGCTLQVSSYELFVGTVYICGTFAQSSVSTAFQNGIYYCQCVGVHNTLAFLLRCQ